MRASSTVALGLWLAVSSGCASSNPVVVHPLYDGHQETFIQFTAVQARISHMVLTELRNGNRDRAEEILQEQFRDALLSLEELRELGADAGVTPELVALIDRVLADTATADFDATLPGALAED